MLAFDEVTSVLYGYIEAAVTQAIEGLSRTFTVAMIVYQLCPVGHCDRVADPVLA